MPASAQKFLGVDFALVTTTQDHELGVRIDADDGRTYVYVKAQGALVVDGLVEIDAAYDVLPISAAKLVFAVSPVAVADNSFGWVVTRGIVQAKIATSVADNAKLGRLSNSSGQLLVVHATGAVAGDSDVFAQSLAAEVSNLASVFIF